MTGLTLVSPLAGWCASLDDSPDPVFSGRILGDGVSIDPTSGDVFAPCDATVSSVTKSGHAVNLTAGNGAELLIHVGIDTVKLDGEGFEARVAAGDAVKTGELLLRFDLEKVARAAPSLRSPVLLLDSPGLRCIRIAGDGPVQPGDALFRVDPIPAATAGETAEANEAPGTYTVERTLVVGLPHGIHARPAALLAEAIKGMDVRLELVNRHGRSASVRSPVGLMAIGVAHRDRLKLVASGADAEAALSAVVPLLEPLAAETASPAVAPLAASSMSNRGSMAPVPSATAERPSPPPGSVIPGRVAAGGLAIGTALQFRVSPLPDDETVLPKQQERDRFDNALITVSAYLDSLATGAEPLGAGIARAHLAMLNDVELVSATRMGIDAGMSAAAAWKTAVADMAEPLGAVEDKRLSERVDDLQDVATRLLSALYGQSPAMVPVMAQNTILVADNLLPSQLLELDASRLAGICLSAGGTTSHAAILAASLGIPMLVAAGHEVLGIVDGAELLLDAQFGELHLRPSRQAAADFSHRIDAVERRNRAALAHAREACVTVDGVRIHVHANLGSTEDVSPALAHGAEGCGLLRTEFLFMHGTAAPTVSEQQAAYQAIADGLDGRPLTIRTLDAGSDKPLNYVDHPPEENPALGIRGIRLSIAEPALFERQLLALLQVRGPTQLKVMLPMVTSVEEIERVRSMLDGIAKAQAIEPDIELGVMLETPAAALTVDVLAEQAAFFSIGTNDLTQYTLAADRGEPRLAASLDGLHPSVLRLIQTASRAAGARDKPVSVCGNTAGDPLAAPILLGLGIRELSMAPAVIAGQKALLREVSIDACERLAADALACRTADQVRKLAREFLTRLRQEDNSREDRQAGRQTDARQDRQEDRQ